MSSALTDLDLHLFGEGNHHHIHRKLGAHPEVHDGVAGTRFAVWAPNARRVSVVGDFNQWDGKRNAMEMRGHSGVWETFVPGAAPGALYKFEIVGAHGQQLMKADPYAFQMQLRPDSASVIADIQGYSWGDDAWLDHRRQWDPLRAPVSIYELHPGSWRRSWHRKPAFLTWDELADQLIPYVLDMGYTHIELVGVAEHPFDGSWGYQVLGHFAPTARHGSPHDFMRFVDRMHQAGIGVFMDWVPAHFPRDGHGLADFDGTALYEHADPHRGEHMEWGTKIFNYGRHEVRNFLIANALFWIEQYHIDGLRVDAVASMIYLDYARKPGEWTPNQYGGRENLEAIEFLKQLNWTIGHYFPGVVTMAEESTSFAGVTRPVHLGGLGFHFKWNMGWMNDTLRYMAHDPIHRRHNHSLITFSFVYAFSEHFILPLSHDEVVHGKRSLLDKMPGDEWQKLANHRFLMGYMTAHPGKKLLFMGGEFGQWHEWRDYEDLAWAALQHPHHQQLQAWCRALNRLYREYPELHGSDNSWEGFRWLEADNANESVFGFMRQRLPGEGGTQLLIVFNATPVPRDHYTFAAPEAGRYRKLLDSDDVAFGGSGYSQQTVAQAHAEPWRDFPARITLNLPPLSVVIWARD
ncbi:1,4-alpha-glucan branching protein GlgB [Steroidobacter sp. S1-65]|uniref:1,4-alpha-glucan branching enzyme GlgB n=1 Tax=Steroidobacter gossypii TaxID=2805490 RepID=A0ABS1WSP1_9GAMM|nr:1,4-alpha-glucan branching protein GlgB [Steroidobacter gossypii]MBM0103967.1 1,4-alpha-glucan branching protein GlgB [Steroidobacter gossypii]